MTREALRLLDLPWDLVLEILSRVPATSLRRLSFTCKRWNALFKDEKFIKKHLDKAANQQAVALMVSDSKVYSISLDYDGVHDNVVDPETLQSLNDFHNPEQFKIYKIFHCDGLLLSTTWDLRLGVWNPCTGQIRWIPYSGRYMYNSEFSLGYENGKSCQAYKILRCSWDCVFPGPRVVDCGIYDFESHSWKDLNDVFPKNCSIVSKAVSLKGNTYWIANKNDEENFLLIFDFSTEKFRCLSLRFPSVVDDFVPAALSVIREERLSVLYSVIISGTPKIEIWMTTHDKIDQTKLVSWTKFLSVELDENNPQIHLSSETSFFIDEEKKVALLCEAMGLFTANDMVFIVGEDNQLLKIPIRKYQQPLIYNYVPSLVRIQQDGTLYSMMKNSSRSTRIKLQNSIWFSHVL